MNEQQKARAAKYEIHLGGDKLEFRATQWAAFGDDVCRCPDGDGYTFKIDGKIVTRDEAFVAVEAAREAHIARKNLTHKRVRVSNKIKAVLPAQAESNAKNLDGDKPRIDTIHAVAMRDGEAISAVEARFWFVSRGSGMQPVYCTIWVRTKSGEWHSGHGKAAGCGYHKASAALAAAIQSAGVKLYRGKALHHIDGVGESAMREAMLAIAKAAGYSRAWIIQ